jgi:hypothetical protein
VKRWALVWVCAAAGSAALTISAAAGPPSSGGVGELGQASESVRFAPVAGPATRSGPARLTAADRAFVARAPASDRLTVLLAGAVGQGDRLVSLVRSMGGRVVRSDDAAGFAIARVAAGRVLSMQSAPVVDALQLDRGKIRIPDDGPEPASATTMSGTAAAATHELPYAPTGDIGAPQFIAEHARFDGRGVTIAMIEGTPDPSAPGLQLTSTGKRKIATVLDATGEMNLTTDRVVEASGDRIAIDGITYTVPRGLHGGSVRFGQLDEATSSAPRSRSTRQLTRSGRSPCWPTRPTGGLPTTPGRLCPHHPYDVTITGTPGS